jgi:tetratricopeptide (TPR) repeat protein
MRGFLRRIGFSLIAVSLLCSAYTVVAADEASSSFKMGGYSLKAGNVFAAYQMFEAAARLEPANRKYSSKLREVGKLASIRAESIAHDYMDKKPSIVDRTPLKEAKTWFEAAIKYDPSNSSASKALADLNASISAAAQSARQVTEAVKLGNAVNAEGALANLARFRSVVPEIESAEKELKAVRLAESAKVEWSKRFRINAIDDLDKAQRAASPDNTYVQAIAKQVKGDIAEFVVREAPTSPSSLKETIRALDIAHNALAVDPTNATALRMKVEQTSRLSHLLLDEDPTIASTSSPSNAARVRLEVLRHYERWAGADARAADEAKVAANKAYPGVRIRLIVESEQDCGVSHNEELVEKVRRSLGQVAAISEIGAALTFRLKKLTCSSSDVPMLNVQQV